MAASVVRKHGGHVGRDHAAALGDAAQLAHFAAQGEAHGNLLGDGIGGHDGLSRARAAGGRILQRVGQLAEILFKRLQRHGLADHARGGHNDVLGFHTDVFFHQRAHALGDFDAVGVTGIGVAAVADDGLRDAVFHVFLRNQNRRALDQILRIDAGCIGGYFTDDQGHVAPSAVAPDAHMLARGGEALRGRRAAGDEGDF